MRKKSISKTYMLGVEDFAFLLIKKSNQNSYLSIKRINKIDKPFKNKNKTIIGDGYYILEYTPLDEYYNIRVFLDDKLNVIVYYFDMTLGNGVENNIPYYDDLYLDIIYSPMENNLIMIDDEDELKEALDNKKITKEEYDLAWKTCNMLVNEIKEKKNLIINMDKKEVIEKYFKD